MLQPNSSSHDNAYYNPPVGKTTHILKLQAMGFRENEHNNINNRNDR